MSKINREALNLVMDALDQYEKEVEGTHLKVPSKRTYLLHARHFVRWLEDDFEPGVNVRHLRASNQPR